MMEIEGLTTNSHLLEVDHSDNLQQTYILGSPVVRGQYSTVYKCLFKGKVERACRVYDKRNVDLKKVKNDLKVITTLSHPNITHIYDAFETLTELQVITERLSGDELFERILSLGHYSERLATKLIRTILSALQYLHENGIVHGDIRPESLIYHCDRPNAPLKLRDVSFSKLAPNSHAVIYLAPEYQEHVRTSKAEDIWSLGIVAYTMLCGLEPIVKNDSESNPLHLPFIEDISDYAKSFVSKMLEHQPENRMSAEEALKHTWMSDDFQNGKHLEITVKNLREFNAKRKFRAATNVVLATKIIGEKFSGVCLHRANSQQGD